VNETWRGVIVFLAVLITIWFWAPLSNHATRAPDGVILTETYFGPLRYLTVRTELKEPDYRMTRKWSGSRLVSTALATAGLWGVVIHRVRRRTPK
jgi:hypothetical protein